MNMKQLMLKIKNDIIGILFATGLVATMLSCFAMQSAISTAILAILVLYSIISLFSINRFMRLLGVAIVGVLVVFLFATGAIVSYFKSCIDMFRALAYFVAGSNNIFLAYSGTVAILLAIFAVILSRIICDEYMSFIAMLIVLIATMYVALQIGYGFEYLYTLPAWIALALKAINKDRVFDIKSNIIAITIIVFTFIIIPYSMGTIKPLNNLANDIKQRIKDYLFFNEEREIFSLNDYGYYPFGVDRFGGKPEISTDPILTVETDKKLYLRGITKDYYTGLAFTNSQSTSRFLLNSLRWRNQKKRYLLEDYPLSMVNDGNLKAEKHKIQLYNSVHSTLFAPAFNRSLSTEGNMVPYFNEIGEIFITRNLAPGDVYTIESPSVYAGNKTLLPLVDRASKLNDSEYTSVASQYLQVPDHIEKAVYELKDKIIANANTPYEKAMAIMSFLQHNYNYSIDVKESPAQHDFVTYFLFAQRKGYCTHFASAMTLLSRMAGLPARYVEGFVANPDSDGLARVTGKQAHAWTEVYLSGFGWLTFDATAPMPDNKEDSPPPPQEDNNQNDDQEDEPTPTPEPEENPEPSPEPSQEPEESNSLDNEDKGNTLSTLLIILIIILLIISIMLNVYYLQPEQLANRETDQRKRMSIYSSAIFIILAYWNKNVPKYNKSKTLFDYCMSIQKYFSVSLAPFANSINRLVYSNQDNLDWEEHTVVSLFNTLMAQIKPIKKIIFMLMFAVSAKLKK